MKTLGSASRRRFKFRELDGFDIRFICWMQKPSLLWLTADLKALRELAAFESQKAMKLVDECSRMEVANASQVRS